MHISQAASRQRGAILVTSLLLLLILTVLGVATMRMTNMQERMAGNTRDVNLALQGAEAALREAERALSPAQLTERPLWQGSVPCTVMSVVNGKDTLTMTCKDPALPVGIYDNSQFDWAANALAYPTAIAELRAPPRYVVEDYMFDRDEDVVGHDLPTGRVFYNVTSRSTGASGQTNVVLQSTYARKY